MRSGRTFRVFISSTFSDLKEERNALQRSVFPRLQRLCARHGCRFQAIDLRWGVSQEAALDQLSVPLCLEEISRCQQVTPRPNFLVLLGDRYGWRPLPSEIPAHEFEQVAQHIEDEESRCLLTTWYRRDDNALPPVYALQTRAGEFREQRVWERRVERPLRSQVLDASLKAGLGDEARSKYTASVTEQEIARGVIPVPDARDHILCFFRAIRDLPLDGRASDFIDVDENGRVDQDAQARLKNLKRSLRDLLPGNIREYEVSWRDGRPTREHLPRFCADVHESLARLILAEIASLATADPLNREIADHEAFRQDCETFFTGRSDVVTSIADYLGGDDRHPLILFGPPGSGKTTVMARAARVAREVQPNGAVLVRFVGATPDSSDSRALLESLHREICRAFGEREPSIPSDERELARQFWERLATASSSRPVIVMLDGLEQLADENTDFPPDWLSPDLPPHVRMVVSTTAGDWLTALTGILPEADTLELGPMPVPEGAVLLDRWLTSVGRTIQAYQREQVLEKFGACNLPLYLKLAFEAARRWQSYTPRSPLSPSVRKMLRDLFSRLSSESNHGGVLVSSSLGYLASAKNGLSEDELGDVLSRDQSVMRDFRRRFPRSPRVTHLPVAVWSRLRHDLAPYLGERRRDGSALLVFYHRQVREAAADFLTDEAVQESHRKLAEYFGEQPLHFGRRAQDVPNLRKLSEWPFQLARGRLWRDVERTLSDLNFIEAKCLAGQTFELVKDYRRALDAAPGSSEWPGRIAVADFLGFVLGQAHVLRAHPSSTAQQAANQPDDSAPARAALALFASERNASPWFRWLNKPQRDAACRSVLIGHTSSVYSCAFSPDGMRIASGGWDGLRVWDVGTGRPWSDQPVVQGPIMLVIWTTRGIWIGVPEDLVRCSRLMRIADHSWQVLENRDVSADEAIAAAVSPDGRLAALSLPSKKVRIHDLETDEEVAIFEVEEARSVAISACSFSLDGRVLITANMFSVRTWDAKSWRQSQELDVASDSELRTRDVQACALSPDGSIVALTHPDMIRLCDARDGVVLGEIRGHSAIVEGCSFSPDGTTIASCSRDGTVRLWSTEAVLSRRTAQAGNYSALPKQAPMFGVATPEWERFPSVTACAFSMDGTMVAVGRLDNRIQLLDSASLADLHPERYSHVIRACDFSPDDRRLALGHDDGSLEIIGVADLHDRAHCRGMAHVHAVTACRFSPDGSLLLSASEDRLLKVWDASTGVLVTVLRGHSGVVSDCAWSPDGRTILSSSLDGTVRIWDAGAGRDVAVLEGHECPVRACSYSPDGARVLSGDTNGILCVWGVRRRILTHRLAGHWGSISRCHWSRDGRLLFSASADGTCRLWMPRDGKMITVFAAGGPVSAFAVAGDGRRFVVGDNERGISLVQVENV